MISHQSGDPSEILHCDSELGSYILGYPVQNIIVVFPQSLLKTFIL